MPIRTGLQGKVVLVTGAASGIGRATALRFAEEGCCIVAWDIQKQRGLDLAAEIERCGAQGLFQPVDVTRSSEIEGAVEEVLDRHGNIHVLVNNAGVVRDAQLVKWSDGQVVSSMSEEAWDTVTGVNLKGAFLCTRAVAPHMIAAQGGVILNASSVVGLYGNFGQTNYAATKAGLIGMTRTWARELGRYNIRVNAVAPGFIGTELVQSVPKKVLDWNVARTPLQRIGRAEEVAEAYLWLASDAAGFVTGTVLSVDGGRVIGT